MELVAFIVLTCAAVFTSAETSEVFAGFWNISKQLENNSLLYVVFFAFSADSQVDKYLWVFGFEFRQRAELSFGLYFNRFLVINTL